jgi:DNA-binding LytR/AlgR family response regulator
MNGNRDLVGRGGDVGRRDRTVTALKAGHGGLVSTAVGLRCLVVGGTAQATNELVRLLHANPTVGRVVTAQDAVAALRVLHSTEVDLAIIELRMPGMDGTDLAAVLNRFQAAPAVVFTAQDPAGAAEAFELGAVDYLTRPLPPARLDRSVRRVQAMRCPAVSPAPDRHPVPTAARGTPAPADDEVIVVSLAGTTRLVRRSSVRWAQAQRDYVRLHTADGSYLIRARMATLAEDWTGTGLIRIHRSYLVRLDCVDGVQTTRSGHLRVTIDGQALPVSRRLVPDIWRMMAGGQGRVIRRTRPGPVGEPLGYTAAA